MTTIRILPEILSNQIAAGEVVQRPASVVKELVENSIDAKATHITIEIARGGKSLIRVSDNGVGLSRDDALLSLERYATSKIFTKDDLFSISTMGFRGEALPSIASVSKFTLVSRTKTSDVGTKIDVAGGRINSVTDAGAPAGTMVEVKHLFFNTPARKKFLKSDNTEVSHIADTIYGMALGHPHVRFRFFLNDRLHKNFSSTDDLFQRSVNVLGKEVAKKLYPLDYSENNLGVSGFVAHPSHSRSSLSKLYLFVNNRLIHDRGLVSAIFKGYKGRLMKGRYPMAAVFISIGFDQVDVNVHPSKREVKFFNGQMVYQALAAAVATAFFSAQENIDTYSSLDHPGVKPFDTGLKACVTDRKSDITRVEQSCIEWPVKQASGTDSIRQHTDEDESGDTPVQPSFASGSAGEDSNGSHAGEQFKASGPQGIEAQTIRTPRIIGQVLGTYILAESEDGLVLMDQHAAHERILYESLARRHQTLNVASQSLLVPETMELNFKESNHLTGLLKDFESLGFHIEHFGGTTFVIKAIPSIIDEREVQPVVMEIVEKSVSDKDGFSKTKWLEESLILMACHKAIRANKQMAKIEMQQLFKDLEACDNPAHCPHGRPIFVTFSKDALEKLFKRLV